MNIKNIKTHQEGDENVLEIFTEAGSYIVFNLKLFPIKTIQCDVKIIKDNTDDIVLLKRQIINNFFKEEIKATRLEKQFHGIR